MSKEKERQTAMTKLRYPTPDELYAIELAARRARSNEMARMLKTAFWQNAARSLHPSVRQRYLAVLQRAERWELALDAALELWSRVKAAVARLFQTPRARHGH